MTMKTRLLSALVLTAFPLLAWALPEDVRYNYDFCVDGIYYLIDREAEGEVTVVNDTPQYTSLEVWEMAETPPYLSTTERTDIYQGAVCVPEQVSHNNETYKVTRIGYAAFAGCIELKKLSLPNSITEIWPGAFYCCKGLTELNIAQAVSDIDHGTFWYCESLKTIDLNNVTLLMNSWINQNPFYGCSALENIVLPYNARFYQIVDLHEGCDLTLNNPVPPEAQSISFSDHTYASATLYVPAGSVDAYKAHSSWGRFSNIAEADPAGISAPTANATFTVNGHTVTAANAQLDIFTITGTLAGTIAPTRSLTLAPGIYLISTAGRCSKIIIR